MSKNKSSDYPQSANQSKKTAEIIEMYQTISAIINNTESRITQRREEFKNAREYGARLTKHRFSC